MHVGNTQNDYVLHYNITSMSVAWINQNDRKVVVMSLQVPFNLKKKETET